MASPRTMVLTYGSFTANGANGYHVDDRVSFSIGYASATFECTIVVLDTSVGSLDSKCETLEAAFRKPRQDTTLTIGGETFITWSHASNTGFDAMPEAHKTGSPWDSSVTRAYRVSITVGLPADNLSQNGRREATFSVGYTPARIKTVTFTGTYTSVAGDAARSLFTANFSTFADTVLTALGGTYEQLTPDFEQFETEKTLQFRVVYHQLAIAKASANYYNGTLEVTSTIDESSPRSRTFVRPPAMIDAVFRTEVDADNVLIQAVASTEWEGTILPWVNARVLEYVSPTLGGGLLVLETKSAAFDPFANVITVRLRYKAYGPGVFAFVETWSFQDKTGDGLVPLWHRDRRFLKHEIIGPATIKATWTFTASVPQGQQAAFNTARDSEAQSKLLETLRVAKPPGLPDVPKWQLQDRDSTCEPRLSYMSRGSNPSGFFQWWEIRHVRVWEGFDSPDIIPLQQFQDT